MLYIDNGWKLKIVTFGVGFLEWHMHDFNGDFQSFL
jgi:hypothetical protein